VMQSEIAMDPRWPATAPEAQIGSLRDPWVCCAVVYGLAGAVSIISCRRIYLALTCACLGDSIWKVV
jgi:hypothetical protein